MNLRQDANQIIKESINRVLPDETVRRVLMGSDLFGKKSGRIYLVAVGKAAWQMAAAAQIILGEKLPKGLFSQSMDMYGENCPGSPVWRRDIQYRMTVRSGARRRFLP